MASFVVANFITHSKSVSSAICHNYHHVYSDDMMQRSFRNYETVQ